MSEEETGRRWFEWYFSRMSGGARRSKHAGVRYICPCCDYPTLSERGGYEICELCNWEDDGQDDPHADEVWGGPNGRYSLTEARENFKRCLIMYNPDDPHRIGRDSSSTELDAKQAIMRAFELMREAGEAQQTEMWKIIKRGEQTLKQELRRKILEWDRKIRSIQSND